MLLHDARLIRPTIYIDAALKLSDGNLSKAARLLGVNRTTLYSRIERLEQREEK